MEIVASVFHDMIPLFMIKFFLAQQDALEFEEN